MLGDSDAIATIAVKDLDKAKEFYESKLGLKPGKEESSGQGIIYKSGNTKVLVYSSTFAGTNQATCASWQVPDVDSLAKDLEAKGIKFEQYDNIPSVKREGNVHVSGDLRAAWFKDPDGNILNIATGM